MDFGGLFQTFERKAMPRETLEARQNIISTRTIGVTQASGSKRTTTGGGKPAKLRKLPETQLEVGPDGFGVDDHFSRLPKDCMLGVFELLTRRQIYDVSTVNRRVHDVTSDPNLDKIKWEGGVLYVHQTQEGYAFELRIQNDDYPWRRTSEDLKRMNYTYDPEVCYSYEYEIIKDSEGRFVETKQVNGCFDKMTPKNPHDWPIPDHLFEALNKIARLHRLKIFSLLEIPFTSIPLNKLADALEGCSVECLGGSSFIGGEVVTDETRRAFARFFKNVEHVNLGRKPELAGIINEEFLRQVGNLKLRSSINCNATPRDVYIHRFHPTEDILPSLLGFKSLFAAAMILDVNWVARFCMMFMDNIKNPSEDDGSWRFAVDRPLTGELLSLQIRAGDYKYSKKNNDHYIVRISDELTAKICPIDEEALTRTVGGKKETEMAHMIDIQFYGKRQQVPTRYNGYRSSPEPVHQIRPGTIYMM